MNAFTPRSGAKPETIIQKKIIQKLTLHGWYCKETHGSEFQTGFADVFVAHSSYGSRWIEVKRPSNTIKFEDSQLYSFTRLSTLGIGVWVLTDHCDNEIRKLFTTANFWTYTNVMQAVTRNRAAKPKISYLEKQKAKRLASVGPERNIQEGVKAALNAEGWYVMETFGSIFQGGLPDLYAAHKRYGQRWIEIKNPKGYCFTPAQIKTFPEFEAKGVAVHVLTSPQDLSLLFGPSNWRTFL